MTKRGVALLAAMMYFGLAMAAEPPAAADGGWGQEVDGLVCRLVLPRQRVCQGEAIPLIAEIRNDAKTPRTIIAMRGAYWLPHYHLDKKEARSYRLRNHYPSGPFRAEAYTTLQPGQVHRFEIPNLNDAYPDPSSTPGKVTLALQYDVPKIAKNAWIGTVTSAPVVLEVTTPNADDLTVHEWGVFTTYQDVEYAGVDLKNEWESLPPFFYRQFPKLRLRMPYLPVRKPIVYFHTKTVGLAVEMKVKFPGGAPVVWWPCCSSPMHDFPATEELKLFQELTWSAWVGDKIPPSFGGRFSGGPPQPSKSAAFTPVPADSWLRQARLEQATPVSVWGTPLKFNRFQQDHIESERFIYYDGLVPAPDHLRCLATTADSITVKNHAAFPLTDLCLVDRRADGQARFAQVAELAAGAEKVIPLIRAPANGLAGLIRDVRQSLVRAGLTQPEAESVLAIWKDGFFNAPGITAWHALPRAEYDRMLPLQITPKPGALVRVGLAHYPRIDQAPVAAQRAKELIKRLDDANFEVREQASRHLIDLGPHAFGQIRAALASNPSLETTQRLEKVLRHAGDASSYLPRKK